MIKNFVIFFLASFLLFGSENDSLFWFDVNDIEDEIPYFPLIINKVFTGNHLSIIDSMKKIEEKELDKVDPSKVEPEDDFKDREDKDIDNDGDVDDSDEYLHKKRQAITKAIKKENKGIGGVVGIPALGDMIKGK